MPAAPIDVIEFTDPGCVWSWGSEPQLRWLRHHYRDQLRWRRVLGVQVDRLAATHPTRDPVRDAEAFRRDWLEVAAHTGAPVPVRLEWMHRSTRPAALAVRAAERQVVDGGPPQAELVLRRLREAVFVAGRPADDPERIAAALNGIAGLDLDRLLADLDTSSVVESVHADWQETRRPHPEVIGRTGPGPNPGAARPDGEHLRYGFPTLLLRGPGGEQVVAGWNGIDLIERAVVAAGAVAVEEHEPLDPDIALARFRTLTAADLRLLTGDRAPSAGRRLSTGTTPIWVHPDEQRGLLGELAAAGDVAGTNRVAAERGTAAEDTAASGVAGSVATA